MGTTVEIRGISKSYVRNTRVLNPVDLTVQSGELFFLLGSSGCGKSTLLRIIAGLLKPDEGSILFDGTDVTNLPPEKRRAAMVFQNYALWPHMSVFENVAFGLQIQGEKKAAIREKVGEMLELVRLADCADRRIQSLSGGQQQRVALARALAVNPSVLLLDEPLSNLDARLRDSMRLEIRRICKERGVTALYVTHDRREALSMADRIAVLDKGNVVQLGTPRQLYRRPVNEFIAGFLGDANFIRGKVVSFENGIAEVACSCGILHASAFGKLAPGTEVTLMMRPEHIRFEKTSAEMEELRCVLKGGSYLGDRTEWQFFSVNDAVTVFEVDPPHREPGSEWTLYVDPSKVIVLND